MIEVVHDGPSPAVTVPKSKTFHCLNGPCQGAPVQAPYDTVAGNACALRWEGPKGARFAVYLVVDIPSSIGHGQGLMYMKSYAKADDAAQRVREISAVCAAGVVEDVE